MIEQIRTSRRTEAKDGRVAHLARHATHGLLELMMLDIIVSCNVNRIDSGTCSSYVFVLWIGRVVWVVLLIVRILDDLLVLIVQLAMRLFENPAVLIGEVLSIISCALARVLSGTYRVFWILVIEEAHFVSRSGDN